MDRGKNWRLFVAVVVSLELGRVRLYRQGPCRRQERGRQCRHAFLIVSQKFPASEPNPAPPPVHV